MLFKEGDTEKRTFYVATGILELVDQRQSSPRYRRRWQRDSPAILSSPVFPRRVSARARDRVQFISIDSDLLDVMLTWDQTGTYEVSELQGKAEEVPVVKTG